MTGQGCERCGGNNPRTAVFCMHCGNRLSPPKELAKLDKASRALADAERKYWQAVRQALAAGHSQRSVASHSLHNHSVLSRKLAKGEL